MRGEAFVGLGSLKRLENSTVDHALQLQEDLSIFLLFSTALGETHRGWFTCIDWLRERGREGRREGDRESARESERASERD
jgi:hypothetical protein